MANQIPVVLDYVQKQLTAYSTAEWLGEWDVKRIRRHRDLHQEGHVWAGKRLARAMMRDANVVAARAQRIAPWLGREHMLDGGDGSIRTELWDELGPRGVMLTHQTKVSVIDDLAMCGVSILQNAIDPRVDGSRWDFIAQPWDLESTDWSEIDKLFVANTKERGRIPIVHGDGKWIVVKASEKHPWDWGAVVPIALHYMSRGLTIVDRAGASKAVGNPKLHGILPPEIAVDSPVGRQFDEAMTTLLMGLAHIVTSDKTQLKAIEFTGQGTQMFDTTIKSDRSDIFLALTGQDGSASNSGGSYTKALVLEGVLFSIVERDAKAMSPALTSGLVRPWALVNYGEKPYPALCWPLPDMEEDARIEALLNRHKGLAELVTTYKNAGFLITAKWIQEQADEMRIKPPEFGV